MTRIRLSLGDTVYKNTVAESDAFTPSTPVILSFLVRQSHGETTVIQDGFTNYQHY